jgi:hypothetical protein
MGLQKYDQSLKITTHWYIEVENVRPNHIYLRAKKTTNSNDMSVQMYVPVHVGSADLRFIQGSVYTRIGAIVKDVVWG